jgi:hypothetical protein
MVDKLLKLHRRRAALARRKALFRDSQAEFRNADGCKKVCYAICRIDNSLLTTLRT